MTRARYTLLIMRVVSCSYLSAALVVGCGKYWTHDRSGVEAQGGGHYEIAWIDPQIVISDSLFTLIKAQRIDSFFLDQPAYPTSAAAPSLVFRILYDECVTSVNLINSAGDVIRPLLVKRLGQAYYKLTIDLSHFNEATSTTLPLYLEANYCGESVRQPIRSVGRPGG